MKNVFYSFVLLSVLSITLTSCTQDAINKLQGEWTVINISDPNSDYVERWEFKNDDVLVITSTDPGKGNSTGKYAVTANFLDTKFTVSDLSNQYNYYNADWTIIELKRNTMYIVNDKDGGLFNRELERK
jgi:hypothetical protein